MLLRNTLQRLQHDSPWGQARTTPPVQRFAASLSPFHRFHLLSLLLFTQPGVRARPILRLKVQRREILRRY